MFTSLTSPPQIRVAARAPASAHDTRTLPSALASTVPAAATTERTSPLPPGTPWTPPRLPSFHASSFSCHTTYETPWGRVQRPTHKITTRDAAKFEEADTSEYGFGAAILSESKFRFSCQDSDLRTLPRAVTEPDIEQDRATVRCVPNGGAMAAIVPRPPFGLFGRTLVRFWRLSSMETPTLTEKDGPCMCYDEAFCRLSD
ncbi:hypothetical protein DFH94DRAFT_857382 [Russula ochroleuca]|uniref:Uncharacterized protein n=1 Tax=Russula ochroleuca TaxID=152965 RepID=A0A9P5MNX4_9AGAM|nr:hypothetical protein DFH94DRAFT_857382 [Russula ochroleuca]